MKHVALLLLCIGSAFPQAWVGILNPARAIDWTQAGVPGGIPSGSWTQSGATITATGSDQTAQINSAITTCSASVNRYVSLAAGTFLINGNLVHKSNCVLRGAGPSLTILDVHGASGNVISMGTVNPSIGVATAISSGATAGSSSIVVASATNMAIGKLLIVNELNDASFVTSTGDNGLCNFCDDIGWNGTRMRMQIVKITNVSGTTITFTPALYSAFTLTPLATPYSASITNAGVENLQVLSNNTGYDDVFDIISCDSCWVKGVESNYADGDHAQVQWSSHVEIRDSYFSNAFLHASGTHDSDVGLIYATSDSKIENNILERLHISTLIERGPSGNVIAYNYSHGNFDRNGGVPTNAVYASLSMHGAHPQFNLMEGNVDDQIYPDSVWGSSSDNTVFRSWAIGTARMCQPVSGRGTVNCTGGSGFWAYQAARAIQVATLNTRWNFVGNVLGSSQQSALLLNGNGAAMPLTASVLWNTNREYDTRAYGWSFGYSNLSDGGTVGTGCTAPCLDTTTPATTVLQHGNYNNIDGSLIWSGSITHTLPASFYLSAKPSWWNTATVPYPAIGPDIFAGTGPGGHVASVTAANPAQACFASMGGTDGGAGSPYLFHPEICYAATGSGPGGLSLAGSVSASGILVIGGVGTQLVLNSVTVSPSNPIIPFNAAQAFSASGLYSDGSTADLTTVATWVSSNPAVASNLTSCTNPGCATFQCVARGIVTVTATYQSVSGNTTLNCQSPTFTPQGTINVTQGGSSVTITHFVGANGTAPFTFSSSDLPGFLSLSNSGCSGSQVNCSLVGTPATVGVFNFHIQATDNLGNQACTAPGCVVGVNVVAAAAEDNTYCNSSEVVIGQPNDPPAGPIQNCNYTAIAGTTLGGSPTTIFVCPIGEKTNTVAIPGCAGAPQPVGNVVPACNQPGGAGTPYYCSMVQSAVNLVANTTGCGSDIRIYATIDSALPGSAMNKYTEPTVVAPSSINCGPDFSQPWWYIRTTEFAKLPPAGNRISPAFAGIASINGRPFYSQTSAFNITAGTYMPMLRAEVRSNGSTFLSSQANATLSGLRIRGVVVAAAHARDAGTDLYGNTVCPLNSAGTPQCTPGGSGGLLLLGCNVVGQNLCGSPGGRHNIIDRSILAGCDDLTMATCYDAMEVHTLFAGGSHLSLIDSYTLHGFCIYLNGPCVDSKSVGGGSSQNGHDDVAVKTVNNYLEASGECFIIGGGTNSSGFYPEDWEFRRNHCYKPLTWKADRPEFGTGGIRDTYAAFSNNATAYSGATTCSVDPPVFGGTTATCHPVVIAGSIADVIIDTPGSGYGLQKKGNGTFVKYPNFYFTDGGVTYTSCGNQLSGDVNTNGTAVTWFDGDKFKGGLAGTNVTINSVNYLVDTVNNGTSITIHTSAGVQTNVPYNSNFNVRGDCIQPVLGIPNVKNLGELKHMKRMLWEGNIGENNWAGQSDQSGLCCLISPKNANNGCPTCTVEDITIRYNFYRNMTSGWQIAISVATQGQTLPAFMKNISLHDNYMDDMNGPLWTTGTAMIPGNAGLAVQFENANPQAGATSKIKMYHNLFLATLPTGFTSTGGSLMNVSGGCNYDKNGTTPALMTYITMEDTIGAGGVRQTSSNSNGCVNCTNNACTYAGKGPTETALRQLFQNDFDLPISGPNYANGQINAISINSGIVNTSGTSVTLVSGHPFLAAMAGNLITINKINYTVATYNSSTSLTLASSAGTQSSKAYSTGAYTCTIPPTTCTVNGGLASGGTAANCSLQTSGTAISRIFPKDTGQRYASTPTISFNGTCTQVPLASAWVAGIGNPKDSGYCFTHNVSLTAAWNGELGMTPLPQTNGDPVNGVCDGVGHNNTDILGVPVTAATWADVAFVNYNTDTGTGAECSNVSTACTNGQPPGTGDLHLKTLSNFYLGATDGRDIGPDADKVIGKSDGTAPSSYTGITIDPVNKVLVLPQ